MTLRNTVETTKLDRLMKRNEATVFSSLLMKTYDFSNYFNPGSRPRAFSYSSKATKVKNFSNAIGVVILFTMFEVSIKRNG